MAEGTVRQFANMLNQKKSYGLKSETKKKNPWSALPKKGEC